MDTEFKDRIEKINQYFTIPEIIPEFKLGSNNCPKCGGKNKLSVYEHNVFCWKTSCEWNTGVPLLKLYQEYNFNYESNGFFLALEDLEKKAGIYVEDNQIELRNNFFHQLKIIYQFYLNLENYFEVKNYLISRNFTSSTIEKLGIGYAPHNKCLQQLNKLNLKDLENFDFLNEKKLEYFSNRIIFPIYDEKNKLVHFQGRYYGDIPQQNNKPICGKYKITRANNKVKNSQKYLALENFLNSYNQDTLYICEGFPDAISLWQNGLPAVGVFGIEGLLNHKYKFKKFSNLIFCFDNDRYENTHPYYPNKYKSWLKVIPQLIELQIELPFINFYIFIPPAKKNIKDINDLSKYLASSKLEQYIQKNKKELSNYLTFVWGNNIEKHYLLIKLLNSKNKLMNLEPYLTNISKVEYANLILKYAEK